MTLKQIGGAKMRGKKLSRILANPLLILAIAFFISLIFVFDVMVVDAYDLGFPRIIYNPPYDSNGFQYPLFDSLKVEGFNCIIVSYYSTTIEDYDSAESVEINLIAQNLHSPYAKGQWARYDAGTHVSSGEYGEYYINYRFKGQESGENSGVDSLDDSIWVWYVSGYDDQRGYIQSGLHNWRENDYKYDFSREQEQPNGAPMTQPLTYYASFRLKVPLRGNHSPSDTVAKIEAWLLNSDSTLNSCTDSVLLYSDFEDSLGYYKNFLISFEKTLANKNDSLDYRIYWFGNTDLFADYVNLWDNIYEKLINNPDTNYIHQIKGIIDTLQPYVGSCLFRWYLV
jgi:hypothetical protein